MFQRKPRSGGRVRWRQILLPAEHGSWGLVLEPILLGWLVAPTGSGFLLGLAAFLLFLAYQPLSLWWADRRRGRQLRRTLVAGQAGTAFVGVALLLLGWVIWQQGFRFLWPLLPALPFALAYLWYDLGPQRRTWQAELSAPIAFAATSAIIVLSADHPAGAALLLWAVLIARALPSILYVRARLRLDKGLPSQPWPALFSHGIALTAAGMAVWQLQLPPLALLVYGLLALRCVEGLSAQRRPLAVRAIGFLEMGLGLLLVLVVGLGWA